MRKRTIKNKMLARIITPIIIILIIVVLLISYFVGDTIKKLRNQEILLSSSNVSGKVSEYFTKYMKVSEQIAVDYELKELLKDLKSNQKIETMPQFSTVVETLKGVHQIDTNNILVIWIADADSSQCIEDTGYISEFGQWDITSRPWYQEVIEAKTTIITEPYQNSSTGEMVSSIINPIYDESGVFLGVAALDLSVDTVIGMMEDYKLGSTGFFMLITKIGNILYAPDSTLLHSKFSDIEMDPAMIQAINQKQYGKYEYRYKGQKTYGNIIEVGDSQWIVLSGMPEKEYNQDFYKVVGIIIGLFLVVIFILILVIQWISNEITKPLRKLNIVSEEIAGGNLDIELNIISDDEIGQVANSIQKTVVRLKDYINYIEEITDVLNQIAEGNLVFNLRQAYEGDFQKVKVGLENIANTLRNTLNEINNSAKQVSGGAEQIADGAQSIAEGATHQASTVEELVATITEISQQIEENVKFAQSAAKRADAVKSEIEENNDRMRNVVNAMNEINKCTNAIENIITNIEDIAEQTNLLSINASIEAARVGEMGKGFAVVASNVGNLSKESVKAVETSTELIQNSLNAVKEGTTMVNSSAEKLENSVKGVIELAENVEKIFHASEKQLKNIEQIRDGIDQIAMVVTDNSAMAEQSAASSEELSIQSQTLNKLIQTFRIEK